MYRNLRNFSLALLLFAALGLVSATNAQAEAPAAPQGDVGVLACYDHARSYSKPSGSYDYPVNDTSYLTTTSYCNDIQIKPTSGRYVLVCFRPSSGAEYCQSNYKWAAANTWTVIATDVLDGTQFYFLFQSSSASNGVWAA
jgi:hypothetical protein